jgi:hypothetical protein
VARHPPRALAGRTGNPSYHQVLPVSAATIRAMPDALEKLPVHVPLAAPNAGPATLVAVLLRVRAEPSGRAWILAEVKLCSFGAPGDWAHSCAP